MIQRIQSVYLLLTTILSVLFLQGDIIKFSDDEGNQLVIDLEGISKIAVDSGHGYHEKLLPLTVLLVMIPVISSCAIFLYKRRKLQLRIVLGLICLTVLLFSGLIYYSQGLMQNFDARILPGLKLILPMLMLISSILAYRGIRKDEKLVQSYDRMR